MIGALVRLVAAPSSGVKRQNEPIVWSHLITFRERRWRRFWTQNVPVDARALLAMRHFVRQHQWLE
jgi:hypothetical protein